MSRRIIQSIPGGLLAALAVLAVITGATTPASAQTNRVTVVADSTLAGHDGYILLVENPEGFDHLDNYFITLEEGQARFFAYRVFGEPDWTVFSEALYIGPPPGATVGDSWATVPDDWGRPSHSSFHNIETITVPAGVFTTAVCVVHPDAMGDEGPGTSEIRHFAQGVGLVRGFWPALGEADLLLSYSLVGGTGNWPLAVGKWWEYELLEGVDYAVGVDGRAPAAAHLLQGAAPNPFNPTTEIAFALASAAHARLSVHDAAGRFVRTLVDESLDAGGHRAVWDGRDASGRSVASGVYFVRFAAGASVQTRPVTLVK
jgi:hypothetical protein